MPPAWAVSRRGGLRTRSQLQIDLAAALQALEPGRAVLVLALDVDDFRRYNAENGYSAGDAFL